jgi:demethylmenaquinone methyltransferase / 2-methoxy-6-polyprenyl-1,4-benzoquinol methylase
MQEINAKKSETIRSMFNAVSARYDLANTVLSLGIHHLWRKKLVRFSAAKAGDKILDCATGTGDLSFEFERVLGANAEILGTDFSDKMLEKAIAKGKALGSRVRFEQVDVMALPFADATFDLATISFGIRNVSDPAVGIAELGRVVKPGGSVVILEFGQPKNAAFSAVYGMYSTRILPKIGGWVSGQPKAYEYLQKSSSAFPCREEFLKLAGGSGYFSDLEYLPVSGGIAYIYKLTRGTRG